MLVSFVGSAMLVMVIPGMVMPEVRMRRVSSVGILFPMGTFGLIHFKFHFLDTGDHGLYLLLKLFLNGFIDLGMHAKRYGAVLRLGL